jgi:hypothetical protein
MRPNVPSLEVKKKLGAYFALNRRLSKIEGYEIGNRNQPNFLNEKRTDTKTNPPN